MTIPTIYLKSSELQNSFTAFLWTRVHARPPARARTHTHTHTSTHTRACTHACTRSAASSSLRRTMQRRRRYGVRGCQMRGSIHTDGVAVPDVRSLLRPRHV